jgi:EmrB/QacA subfamily drug resistance transporter
VNLSPSRLRALLIALTLVSLLSALDHTIIASSLATVTGELGGVQYLTLVIVGYTLAVTIAMPVFGRLGDIYGRRGLFLGSVSLFIIASLLCGFSNDMAQLTGARVLQGIGGAGVQILSQTVLADAVALRQRAKYQAIVGASFPIAILLGPLAGGLLTDTVGWRWIFWMNAPLGLIALLLAARSVPRSVRTPGRGTFDVPGAMLLGIATASLVSVVTLGGGILAWDSPQIIILGGVAMLATVGFFIVELRSEHPLIPITIFRRRVVVVAITLGTVVGVGLLSVVSYLPTYIQMVYRTSATVAGLVPLASVSGMLVASLISGFVVSRTGRYRAFPIFGTAAGAVGLFGTAFTSEAPLWVVAALMTLVGFGSGSFMQLLVVIVQAVTDPAAVGAVTSTVHLVRQIFSTVASAVVGGLFASRLVAGVPSGVPLETLTPSALQRLSPQTQVEVAAAYGSAMAPIFIGLSFVFALGFIAALMLPHHELTDQSSFAADEPTAAAS